ncbi:DUF2092 domain-containing protein [Niveibacterium sp. SC-1]|uniref:DUF2092 domain-containing protein n=1 Tax=Niveibacterium sp. SC-1 TaxID=3135646 RepID=UPI00311E5B9E
MRRTVFLAAAACASLLSPHYVLADQAASSTEAANPVDPKSVDALRKMGTYLQSLKSFGVTTQLTAERVLEDGQKLQHAAEAELQVARPNKLRAKLATANNQREILYDGKTVVLYSPAQKYYSSLDWNGSIGELATGLQRKYGVELPLADLFLWGTAEAPFDKIESAMNAGQDLVDGEVCDHYAFREGQLDWQIWILAGAKPLPRKVVITNRADEARPQSVSTINWNLNAHASASSFSFSAPKGSKKIEIVPMKTN